MCVKKLKEMSIWGSPLDVCPSDRDKACWVGLWYRGGQRAALGTGIHGALLNLSGGVKAQAFPDTDPAGSQKATCVLRSGTLGDPLEGRALDSGEALVRNQQ